MHYKSACWFKLAHNFKRYFSATPNSFSLRVKVLRPQPSNAAASPRRPAACSNAASSKIRSNTGVASSSRLLAPSCKAPSAHWRKACCQSLASRSEEHTSELQSRPHLVCRLLLEKKKNKKKEI